MSAKSNKIINNSTARYKASKTFLLLALIQFLIYSSDLGSFAPSASYSPANDSTKADAAQVSTQSIETVYPNGYSGSNEHSESKFSSFSSRAKYYLKLYWGRALLGIGGAVALVALLNKLFNNKNANDDANTDNNSKPNISNINTDLPDAPDVNLPGVDRRDSNSISDVFLRNAPTFNDAAHSTANFGFVPNSSSNLSHATSSSKRVTVMDSLDTERDIFKISLELDQDRGTYSPSQNVGEGLLANRCAYFSLANAIESLSDDGYYKVERARGKAFTLVKRSQVKAQQEFDKAQEIYNAQEQIFKNAKQAFDNKQRKKQDDSATKILKDTTKEQNKINQSEENIPAWLKRSINNTNENDIDVFTNERFPDLCMDYIKGHFRNFMRYDFRLDQLRKMSLADRNKINADRKDLNMVIPIDFIKAGTLAISQYKESMNNYFDIVKDESSYSILEANFELYVAQKNLDNAKLALNRANDNGPNPVLADALAQLTPEEIKKVQALPILAVSQQALIKCETKEVFEGNIKQKNALSTALVIRVPGCSYTPMNLQPANNLEDVLIQQEPSMMAAKDVYDQYKVTGKLALIIRRPGHFVCAHIDTSNKTNPIIVRDSCYPNSLTSNESETIKRIFLPEFCGKQESEISKTKAPAQKRTKNKK